MTAEEIKGRGYNLGIENPHTSEDNRGAPEELLARLNAAEAARLHEQLKAILREALSRER